MFTQKNVMLKPLGFKTNWFATNALFVYAFNYLKALTLTLKCVRKMNLMAN